MKSLKAIFLILALFLATFAPIAPAQTSAQAQGYDVGVCGAQDFVALHIVASEKDITVQFVSLGPNRLNKVDPQQVYKFTKSDAAGLHYVSDEGKDGKYELVLKFDKDGVNGLLYVDNQKAAKFYGAKAADETNLKETAFILYQMCIQMNEPSGASTS
jgi:hypothetical protein